MLKAPFPYFGGKARAASLVWDALGDVAHYIEPFGGSLAVLLARPAEHRARMETVNDANRYLANFWRAIKAAPEAVAEYADWPINEADLHARHLWLVNEGRAALAALDTDPDWYDPKIAGWWVWGQSAWIGRRWCSAAGVRWRKRLQVSRTGQDVPRQLPHVSHTGEGVHRVSLTSLGMSPGQGLLPRTEGLYEWFRALAQRLRRVRVCCGDWSRVLTEGVTCNSATVGVFLDPPYQRSLRDGDLYAVEADISGDVRRWALQHGTDPRFRIVLAGFEDEHKDEMQAAGWRMLPWQTKGSYQTRRSAQDKARGNQANRHKERLWVSPYCLDAQVRTVPLLAGRE